MRKILSVLLLLGVAPTAVLARNSLQDVTHLKQRLEQSLCMNDRANIDIYRQAIIDLIGKTETKKTVPAYGNQPLGYSKTENQEIKEHSYGLGNRASQDQRTLLYGALDLAAFAGQKTNAPQLSFDPTSNAALAGHQKAVIARYNASLVKPNGELEAWLALISPTGVPYQNSSYNGTVSLNQNLTYGYTSALTPINTIFSGWVEGINTTPIADPEVAENLNSKLPQNLQLPVPVTPSTVITQSANTQSFDGAIISIQQYLDHDEKVDLHGFINTAQNKPKMQRAVIAASAFVSHNENRSGVTGFIQLFYDMDDAKIDSVVQESRKIITNPSTLAFQLKNSIIQAVASIDETIRGTVVQKAKGFLDNHMMINDGDKSSIIRGFGRVVQNGHNLDAFIQTLNNGNIENSDTIATLSTLPNPALSVPLFANVRFDGTEKDRFVTAIKAIPSGQEATVITQALRLINQGIGATKRKDIIRDCNTVNQAGKDLEAFVNALIAHPSVMEHMYTLSDLPNPALSVPLFAGVSFSTTNEKDRFATAIKAIPSGQEATVITQALRLINQGIDATKRKDIIRDCNTVNQAGKDLTAFVNALIANPSVMGDMYTLSTLPNPALSVPLFANARFSSGTTGDGEKNRLAKKLETLKNRQDYDNMLIVATSSTTHGVDAADIIRLLPSS